MTASTPVVNDLVVPHGSPQTADVEGLAPTGERSPVTLPVGGHPRPDVVTIPASDLAPGDVILVGPARRPETVDAVALRADGMVAVVTTVARRIHGPNEMVEVPSLGDLPRANGGPVASGQVVTFGTGDPELFIPYPTVFVERTPLAQDAFDARRRGPQ